MVWTLQYHANQARILSISFSCTKLLHELTLSATPFFIVEKMGCIKSWASLSIYFPSSSFNKSIVHHWTVSGKSGTSNILSSSGKMVLFSLLLSSCLCCRPSNLQGPFHLSSSWSKRSSTTVPAKGFAGSRSLKRQFSNKPAGFLEDLEDDLVEAYRKKFFDFFLGDQAAGPGSDFRLSAGILTI